MRRALREAGAFALFAALAVALTWPLALHLDSSVASTGAPLVNAAILDWVCHAAVHAPFHPFDPPFFHPGLHPLAYGENMIGIALVLLPFHLGGAGAIALQNLALLIGFAFSGYGAFVLARMLSRNSVAAFLAGILFAFSSFMLSHVEHVQNVWSGWLPLLLAALLAWWRTPRRKSAILLGAAFFMNGLTSIHWLLYGSVALVATVALLAVREPRHGRAFWLQLASALLLGGALLLPVLFPYQQVAEAYDARRTTPEVREWSASWTDWVVPSARERLYGRGSEPSMHRPGRELFPGLLVLFFTLYLLVTRERREQREELPPLAPPRLTDLAIVAALALTFYATLADRVTLGRISFSGADIPAMLTIVLLGIRFRSRLGAAIRRSRFTAEEQCGMLWIALGVLASLGWNAFLHPFLFRVIEPFRATRTPATWAIVALTGFVVLTSSGAALLLSRRSGRARNAIAALLILLAILEAAPRIDWKTIDPKPAPVYRWLAKERPGVVLELPMTREGAAERAMLASTWHRVPIVNGASGWETPVHKRLRKKEDALAYDAEFFAALREAGCTIVLVHESQLSPEQRRALDPLLARLEPVLRFGSDAVYAVTGD